MCKLGTKREGKAASGLLYELDRAACISNSASLGVQTKPTMQDMQVLLASAYGLEDSENYFF